MLKIFILFVIIKITSTLLINQQSEIFEIQWLNSSRPSKRDDVETFDIISSMGEAYTCFILKDDPKNLPGNSSYKGPLAMDFIEHLFNKGICSYRLDPFWTYEICHGRYIRQYHEVLEGTSLKLQQYTLGKMGVKERQMVIRKMKEEETKWAQNSTFKIPTKRVGNKELPYVEFSMSDGSICEYNRRKLRKSNVKYMCDMKGNHDLHSVQEVASCVYEIIILTPLLCAHPKFRPKRIPRKFISCYANGKSPRVPYNQAKTSWERKKLINNTGRMKLLSYDKKSGNSIDSESVLVSDFLSGKNCISGGTGDWKYEFCYGKYINQYTYGIFGLKTTVCLGKFNLDKHVEWIRSRPYKRPKPVDGRTYITQFYTDGCISDVTGKPRQTEVKLNCMENAPNGNALVMYLHETNFGEYLLGVESPILCHVIPMADEDGLVFFKT